MKTEDNKKTYTIILFTEDTFGMLNKVTNVLTRRRINLESITLSNTSEKDVIRMTLVINLDPDSINKLVGQINKLIGVFKVFSYLNEEIVVREIALYKLQPLSNEKLKEVNQLITPFNAEIITSNEEFVLVEQTGTEDKIFELYQQLQKYTMLDFAKSGRVAAVLHNQEQQHVYPYNLDQKKTVTINNF